MYVDRPVLCDSAPMDLLGGVTAALSWALHVAEREVSAFPACEPTKRVALPEITETRRFPQH